MPTKHVLTAARKVQLYREVSGGGQLRSYAPKCWLDPVTPVEIVYNTIMMAKGLPYVRCYVSSGVHEGKMGYIPRHGVVAGYVMNLTGHHGETFTGIKYGSYKTAADASRAKAVRDVTTIGTLDGKAFKRSTKAAKQDDADTVRYYDLLMATEKNCPICCEDRGDHKILETVETRDTAMAIHDNFRLTLPAIGGVFMMGVLITSTRNKARRRAGDPHKTKYFAMSDAAGATAKARAETYCTANEITFVRREKIDNAFLKNFKGEVIETPLVASDDVLGCAAPKLLQNLLQNVGKPDELFMSEIWYKNGGTHARYTDRSTIDSCDRCRLAIPSMLCGLKNPYSKARQKRPADWKSIGEFCKAR